MPAVVRRLPEPKQAEARYIVSDDQAVLANLDSEPEVGAAPIVGRPSKPAVVAPLEPERYKLQVTLSADMYQTLRRAQNLLRHSVPNGDLAAIVDRALKLLVRELERTKCGETDRPRIARLLQTRSRHIPAAVRRLVWKRDGGQCAFIGTEGRCMERGFLEFHHVVPYADGGESVVENLELRCRAHNAYEFDRWSGTLLARESPPVFPCGTDSVWTEFT